MVYGTAHFFKFTNTRSRFTATDPPWPLSASFEATVSGKTNWKSRIRETLEV